MSRGAALIDTDSPTAGPASSIAATALTWTFLCLLTAAPLLRAGDAPWAWSLIAVLAAILLTAWGLSGIFSGSVRTAPLGRLWPSAILFLAVVLWAAIQGGVPVPEAWRPALAQQAARFLDMPAAAPLSLDPERSLAATARLLGYGAVFLFAFQIAQTRQRAVLMLRGIVVIALVCTAYGLLINFVSLDYSPWPVDKRSFGHLTATFPDRNVFASFAGISMIAALALLFRPKMRSDDLDTNRRAVARAVLEYFFSRSIVGIAAAAILFGAVILTHSRSGLAAALAGIGIYLIIVTRSWRSRRAISVTVAIFGLAAAALLMAGGAKTFERIAIAPDAAVERGEVYRVMSKAIADAPLTGMGYGAFRNVFPTYRSENLTNPFQHGHNIYLENALELGVPAAAALVIAVGWIGLMCLGRARKSGRESFFPSLGVAVTIVIGLHSLTDSTLRAPAVAMLFAALLGIAASQTLALKSGRPLQTGRNRR